MHSSAEAPSGLFGSYGSGMACLMQLALVNLLKAAGRQPPDGKLTIEHLIRIASTLGLEARYGRFDWQALRKIGVSSPLLILLKNTNLVLVMGPGRGGDEEIAVWDPLDASSGVLSVPRKPFEQAWDGHALTVAPQKLFKGHPSSDAVCTPALDTLNTSEAVKTTLPDERNVASTILQSHWFPADHSAATWDVPINEEEPPASDCAEQTADVQLANVRSIARHGRIRRIALPFTGIAAAAAVMLLLFIHIMAGLSADEASTRLGEAAMEAGAGAVAASSEVANQATGSPLAVSGSKKLSHSTGATDAKRRIPLELEPVNINRRHDAGPLSVTSGRGGHHTGSASRLVTSGTERGSKASAGSMPGVGKLNGSPPASMQSASAAGRTLAPNVHSRGTSTTPAASMKNGVKKNDTPGLNVDAVASASSSTDLSSTDEMAGAPLKEVAHGLAFKDTTSVPLPKAPISIPAPERRLNIARQGSSLSATAMGKSLRHSVSLMPEKLPVSSKAVRSSERSTTVASAPATSAVVKNRLQIDSRRDARTSLPKAATPVSPSRAAVTAVPRQTRTAELNRSQVTSRTPSVKPVGAEGPNAIKLSLSIKQKETLLSRGDAVFSIGDITSARLYYQYGADAGDGVAALRLGETFDPAFISQLHLGRVQGDSNKALFWYRRARDLGNKDAAILLERVHATKRDGSVSTVIPNTSVRAE